MSNVRGVGMCMVVERGLCVCWQVLFGPAPWRGRVGRVSCVVVDEGVYVV